MHTKYSKYTQRKHSHFKQQDGIKVIISILLTQVFRLMNFHVENFSRRIPNIQTQRHTVKQANSQTGVRGIEAHKSAHHIRNNSILTTAFPTANYQSKFFLPEFVVLVENTRTYITLYPQIHAHSANTKRQYCHLPFVVVVHSRERLLRTIRKRCLLCTHCFGLLSLAFT